MLKNYLIIAYRALWQRKGYTGINVVSLALSLAVCFLIIAFLWDQRSYDRFHEHADRIYRVVADAPDPEGDIIPVAATPAPLAEEMERAALGVEETVRLQPFQGTAMQAEKRFDVQGLYAGAAFFDVFSFPLAEGRTEQALTQPNTIVLAQEAADWLFGERNPIGELVTLEGRGTFTVTGVLGAADGKSHLKFDALLSYASLGEVEPDWRNFYSSYTYLRLTPEGDAETVEAGVAALARQHYSDEEQARYQFALQPLTAINLGSIRNNEIGFMLPGALAYILMALGLLIMLTAGFNYVGLSVAQALTRAREVGVRKVLGAWRAQLVGQFVGESVLLAGAALVIAVMLLLWLVPAFNALWFVQESQTRIDLALLTDPMMHLILLGFTVLVGGLAGLYPALYLSRFLPVRVLKGGSHGRGLPGSRLRKVLIGAQFAFSVFLVVTISAIYGQLQFMQDADYGFDADDVINVALKGEVAYETLRAELLQHPAITEVSATSKLPASGSVHGRWARTEGMAEPVRGYEYGVDEHFIDNMDLRLIAGRNLSSDFPGDVERTIILNERAVQALGLGTPTEAVGQTVTLNVPPTDGEPEEDAPQTVTVIGVVADFNFNLLVSEIDPMLIRYLPDAFRYANVRVRPGGLPDALEHLETTWASLVAYPLDYQLFSEQIANSPINVVFRDFVRVVGLVAGLALLIACLGLLGMAAFSAETRRKEVGIRKTLGARTPDLVLLLSKDFLKLVVGAVVVAAPLAWFANSLWLQQFAHRFAFSPLLLLAAVAVLLLPALLTIGSQTWRAALADPVKSLRYE